MDEGTIRAAAVVARSAARNANSAIINLRGIVNAPPDPKPRHRWNLLTWRLSELQSAATQIQVSCDEIETALGDQPE